LHSPDGKKRGGADAVSLGSAAGDAGRYGNKDHIESHINILTYIVNCYIFIV